MRAWELERRVKIRETQGGLSRGFGTRSALGELLREDRRTAVLVWLSVTASVLA